MSSFLDRWRLLTLLVMYAALVVWFVALERWLVPRHQTGTALDAHIPFVAWFIIPYLLWFPLIAATLGYFFLASPEEYVRLLCFLYLGMASSLILFMVFPNGQDLRPTGLGPGLVNDMVRFVYDADTPTNSAPSIHALQTVGLCAAAAESVTLRRRRWPVLLVATLGALIIASTVLVKQHAILDTVLGAGLGAGLWVLVYRTPLLTPAIRGVLSRLLPAPVPSPS